MGGCSSKGSADLASKKNGSLPAPGAKKPAANAPAKVPTPKPQSKPAQDDGQLKFVPAKDDKHAAAALAEKPPVELSVAPPADPNAAPAPLFPRSTAAKPSSVPPPPAPTSAESANAARATSTARVEEVVLETAKPAIPHDDGGAAIRRAPPPAPTAEAEEEEVSAESAGGRRVAWEQLRERLPREKTPEDKQRRLDLFREFDKDQSGALTYDEVHKGCVDILHLNRFTPHLHDITKRAFNKAKDMGTKDRGAGDEDQVEFLEFRLMLCYIHDYFELTVMFDEIDKDGSMMIDKDEFVSKAAPMLSNWGIKMNDPAKTFDDVDVNDSGILTFEEFASWATDKKAEASGDPDAGVASLPVPEPPTQEAQEEEPKKEEEQPKKADETAPAPVQESVKPAEEAAAPPVASRAVPPPPAEAETSTSQDEPSATERKAEWNRIQALLPCKKTPEDKQRRVELFEEFDKDKSVALTYDEVYKGCVNILHLNRFTSRLRDITKRAFNKAKDMGTKDRGAGDEDQVEFLEFRLMLCYIHDYFELTVMFDEIDKDGSMMIDKDEFVSKAAPMLNNWGVDVTDPEAIFNAIDANGSKQLTFDEFATWATDKKVDVTGDPDAAPAPAAAAAAAPPAPPAPEPEPAQEDAQGIEFTDESELVNEDAAEAGEANAVDAVENDNEDEDGDHNDEDDDDDDPSGQLDPRRVYGFDGDSTGLGVGAKEDGGVTLNDMDNDPDVNGDDAVVDDVDRSSSDQVDEVQEIADDEEEEEKKDAAASTPPPPPPPAAKSSHVDPMADDDKPMRPVVVRATKEPEYEMGDANDGHDSALPAVAPRALSVEAVEVPVVIADAKMTEESVADAGADADAPPAKATTAGAIQQSIMDDLFGDVPSPSTTTPASAPPPPRRLPPPMPSPAERGEQPEDADDDDQPAEAAPIVEEVVATPPPARRAPPPMFSPPPPDADSEAENSVTKDVEDFYGRGAEEGAAAAAAAASEDTPADPKEKSDAEDDDEPPVMLTPPPRKDSDADEEEL